MSAKRVVAALVVLAVLGAMLVGCGDSDVQTGTYVGWDATFEGDDTSSYMIELEDGTKVMAASDGPAPEMGAEVQVRKLDDGTWEIVPDE